MLSIITFVVGFISGMYVVTQIEKGIDKNIDNDEPIVEHDGMRYNPETLEFKEMDKNINEDKYISALEKLIETEWRRPIEYIINRDTINIDTDYYEDIYKEWREVSSTWTKDND